MAQSFSKESPRVKRLRSVLVDKQAAKVTAALKSIWLSGRQPDRIMFRRQFARLDTPVTEAVSDRKLPDKSKRPPSTRLLNPRGVAQALYLTMVFVAQCERQPGQQALPRPITVSDPTQLETPWIDLVMVPATRRAGSSHHLVEDNRADQLRSAVRYLAGEEIGLVGLPHADEPRGKLAGFIPLMDSGLVERASRTIYKVPDPTSELFSVPADFFLNGWHSVLTPSEIAMLFAVWAASPNDSASKKPVWLEGETRIRRYGLSPEAYGKQTFLRELDILAVEVPEGRRPDGTFIGLKDGESPLLNSFMVLEDGFKKPAAPRVLPQLRN